MFMPDCIHYGWLTVECIRASSFCTPRLREELSQLSLQVLYKIFESKALTTHFWELPSIIIEMLHKTVSHYYLHCGEKLLTNARISRSNSLTSLLIFLLSVSTLSTRLIQTKH